jgi:putative inorganic carbon (HCO3(-)) transporter
LTSEWDFLYNKVHNEYLNFLSNSGTLGFFSYLLLIGYFVYYLRSQPQFLIAFISILITNFAGFSVAVISLLFFLSPLLAIKLSPAKPPKLISYLVAVLILFLSSYSLLQFKNYFLADVTFATSDRLDSQDKYLLSYQNAIKSYQLNPREPVYLSRLSLLSSKISLAYYLQKNQNLATTFSQNAILFSNQALRISPFNINLLKERAQALSYLIGVDSTYEKILIDTLKLTTTLAPTDAKSFYLLSKFESPETNLQKAITLKSNYDFAYFDLGVLYFKEKKYDQAKINFENCLKYAPGNQNAKDYLEKM